MIFKKITEACKPPFNKPVLLLRIEDHTYIVTVGYMTSIDAKGFNFSMQTDDMISIFGAKINTIKPTHWCEIIVEFEEHVDEIKQ